MTEAHNRTRFLVRPVEVAAGAMAAITGAFIGSRLGVAGTAIGAGIVSVISSIGAVVYEYWLDRTGRSVLSRLPVSREPRAMHALMRLSAAVRRRAALTIVLPLSLFALALAVVTGVEVLHGGPLSGEDSGATVGSLFGRYTTAPATTSDAQIQHTSPAVPPSSTGESPPSKTTSTSTMSTEPTATGTSTPTSVAPTTTGGTTTTTPAVPPGDQAPTPTAIREQES